MTPEEYLDEAREIIAAYLEIAVHCSEPGNNSAEDFHMNIEHDSLVIKRRSRRLTLKDIRALRSAIPLGIQFGATMTIMHRFLCIKYNKLDSDEILIRLLASRYISGDMDKMCGIVFNGMAVDKPAQQVIDELSEQYAIDVQKMEEGLEKEETLDPLDPPNDQDNGPTQTGFKWPT